MWLAITRALWIWRHRRALITLAGTALAAQAAFWLLIMMALGGAPEAFSAAVSPQCADQMRQLGIASQAQVSFGPGPIGNGKTIIATGQHMHIPRQGILIALIVAMQESGMRNLANDGTGQLAPDQHGIEASLRLPHDGVGHNHGSLGIMQQQWPWWGTMADLMTPAVAARKFYEHLLHVGGWQQMAPTVAAQAVQHSLFPDAYAAHMPAAAAFYAQYAAQTGVPDNGGPNPAAAADEQPPGANLCVTLTDPDAAQNASPRPGSAAGIAAVRAAEAQIGLPYVWGGGDLGGPTGGGFDCSGLVRYALFQGSGHRVVLPRRTYEMVHYGRTVFRNAVQPGDLVFLNPDGEGPGHVAMVVNPTTIVEAQTFGVPVKLSPFPTHFVVIKRYL